MAIGTIKYGVKLVVYGSHPFEAWVYLDDRPFTTYDHEEALKVKSDYEAKNSKGLYVVMELPEGN